MKIYDQTGKKILSSVTLFLTPSEARQLADDARDLSGDPDKHHQHITDDAYHSEITVSVYTEK